MSKESGFNKDLALTESYGLSFNLFLNTREDSHRRLASLNLEGMEIVADLELILISIKPIRMFQKEILL